MNSKNVMVRIKTRRGAFRMHLAGEGDALQAVEPTLKQLAETADGPEDFLEKATPELARHGVIVADTFDTGPEAPQHSIADRVRMIMNNGPRATAEICYAQLLATFQVAEPNEIDALLDSPEDLTLVAEYTNDILMNLDEDRARATDQMRRALSPAAAYLILGPENE